MAKTWNEIAESYDFNRAALSKQKLMNLRLSGKKVRGASVANLMRASGIKEEEFDESELDQIEEVLAASAGKEEWIHDFVHSDNAKFEGKSKKERIKMALGAYYGKQNEEVESIDEKSEQARKNKTMKNMMDASKGAQFNRTSGLDMKPGDTGHQTAQQMNKAIGRNLRREEVELEEGNGYDDNRTGFAKKPREDDEYHNEPKPKFKAKSMMDRPHDVHIDGKKWKTFSNGHQAHAAVNTLQSKGKKATATAQFKEETMDTLTKVRSLISAKVNEAKYAGLEKEDKKGLPTAMVKKSEKAVAGDTVEGWDHPHEAVKEGKTFKEFAMMLEYESDESGRYVHKGKKNYGNDNDDFDQHDDFEKKLSKPAAEKRGRGRPAGAKSGAGKISGTSKLYK